MLDAHLKMLLQDRAAAADAPVQSRRQQELRACLALRLMLLETRQQLHLLCSNFAAARVDAAESINVQQQFPKLLAGLEPMVHLQAGLYAQAVGAAAAAAGHFMAAAGQAQEQGELHLAADARHLAVVCYVADNTRESGGIVWDREAHAQARGCGARPAFFVCGGRESYSTLAVGHG